MSTDERKAEGDRPDGPGEAVIDEPTAHALDPEADPNNEWEESAAEQMEGSGSEKGDAPQTSGDEDAGPPTPDEDGSNEGDGDEQIEKEADVAEDHDAG